MFYSYVGNGSKILMKVTGTVILYCFLAFRIKCQSSRYFSHHKAGK